MQCVCQEEREQSGNPKGKARSFVGRTRVNDHHRPSLRSSYEMTSSTLANTTVASVSFRYEIQSIKTCMVQLRESRTVEEVVIPPDIKFRLDIQSD